MTLPSEKRILLIAPKYFGYDRVIGQALRDTGVDVIELPDRPFDSALLKAITRFRPELTRGYADRYYAESVDRIQGDVDQILVIQGEAISVAMLRSFRSRFPRARLVFYSWDSLRQKPYARKKLDAFDAGFTFDESDALSFGLNFRPLFFSPGFQREAIPDFRYELSFVGTIHADRYSILRCIDSQLDAADRRYWYMYMQAPWMYWARRLMTRTVTGARQSDFSFQPLSQRQVQDVFLSSRAVLDIEHPRQTGLTMRTLEALGSGTKLVTTNSAVRQCDFYNSNNICIIDRHRPVLPRDFLHRDYEPLPTPVYERYSLGRWLREVCGDVVSQGATPPLGDKSVI
ncbi:hypothetical protein [Pelomonas sp. KK5]|uniref:hypothetical protein n=1 Tax=Pelomonas sp. KK5 TaxID=1855730 RepID=UPI00117D8B65|nr:hypothetical protein [Pelomonas sp. KK5]